MDIIQEAKAISAEFKEIEAEYNSPDSLIDTGNWYYISKKQDEVMSRLVDRLEWKPVEINGDDIRKKALLDSLVANYMHERKYSGKDVYKQVVNASINLLPLWEVVCNCIKPDMNYVQIMAVKKEQELFIDGIMKAIDGAVRLPLPPTGDK